MNNNDIFRISITSTAKRSRISWTLGDTKVISEHHLTHLYKSVRDDLKPYHRPNSNIPWGPPEEFSFVVKDINGESKRYLRMVAGCPRDHVLCDLDLLHSLLRVTDVFSQAVQTLFK